MSLVDPLANALVNIKNHEIASKKECIVRPASKLIGEILRVLKENDFIEGFERINDGREGIFKIKLKGSINDCSAIKPRYAVRKSEFEKFEKRYLPSKDVGILIITTPKGVMSQKEAKKNLTGGRLLAFAY